MTLKEWLIKKKLTQKALAEMLGCTQSAVNGWIKGSFRPCLSMAVKIEQISGGKVKPSSFYPMEERADV